MFFLVMLSTARSIGILVKRDVASKDIRKYLIYIFFLPERLLYN